MEINNLSEQVFKDMLEGKIEFEHDFLALKILLSRLRLKLKYEPGSLPLCVAELKHFFERYGGLQGVKSEFQQILSRQQRLLKSTMQRPESVEQLILQGKKLLLAGDETVLAQLPPGKWIGGTIPYFMTEQGGLQSRERIFLTELPDYVKEVAIKRFSEQSIHNVYLDPPRNGFSVIIIPAMSPTHFSFALNAPKYQAFATSHLIGWIAGIHLDDLGKITPKVFDGQTREAMEDGAVVMQISLPEQKQARMNIINIFKQGQGDSIFFANDGFSASEALINGQSRNFAEYLLSQKIDIRLPLVADYSGVMINTSFQGIDESQGKVSFYAPVFQGVEYRHAAPVGDYVTDFTQRIPGQGSDQVFFSCNCILNYLYSELEGKKTGGFTGPITFGEIAYQLVNQTLVYLDIFDR